MQSILDLQVALASQPWALESGALAAVEAIADAGPRGLIRASVRPTGRLGRGHAGTAVISVVGPIQQHRGIFEALGVGASCDTVSKQLRAALADDDVERIVFDFDSPGGSVFGVGELAAEIRAARGAKPIVAIANSQCASAAYWIASACSEIYCTPGGAVGSIGVIAAHQDLSAALDAAGVKTTLITFGKFKAEGSPFEPLGTAAKAAMQRMIDSYGSDFTNAVAKGRNASVDAVRSDMGQGRMMRADAAQAAGMTDGTMTFDEVLARRIRPAISRTAAASAYARMPRALASAMRRLELLSI